MSQLTALAGRPARQGGAIGWPRVEASLGLRLPADYRALLDALPDGAFRAVLRLNRPGDQGHPDTDFLGFYAYRLEDMRTWRDEGRGSYPYPIFPEPGGLLPWASGPRLEQVFWLTADDDPDGWPVVLADAEFERWDTHPGPAARFLLDALEGRFDTRPFGYDLAAGGPAFVPAAAEPEPEPGPSYRPARDFFSATGRASDEFAALAALLGPAPPARPGRDDGLPADYRQFLATYGPGRLGEISVRAPDAAFLGDVHARLRLAHFPCAVYPEPGGIVAWGTAGDGWLLAWAPTAADPQRWGTVTISGDLVNVRHAAQWSFSGLLRRYADPAADPPHTLAGLARPAVPVRFVPA